LNEQIVFDVVKLWSSWSLCVAFIVAYWCICGSF